MYRSLIAASALAVLASPALAVELVTNGDFETGSFAGWTVVLNQSTKINSVAANVFDGHYSAQLHTSTQTVKTLSQLVNTTLGYSYELSYWLRNNGKAKDSFTVTSGNVVMPFVDRNAFGWTQFVQDFVAQGPKSLIQFNFVHLNAGSFFLDDVSVSVIPEPASWVMLIAGFGLTGAALRRRDRRKLAGA